MRKFTLSIILILLVLLLASGCAPGPGPSADTPGTQGDAAGFWKGLWHGFIVLFTFVVSLFSDDVGIYELHNNGSLYNLGFVLGAMIFFGSSGGGACKKTGCKIE